MGPAIGFLDLGAMDRGMARNLHAAGLLTDTDSTFKMPSLPERACIVNLRVGPHRPLAGLGPARPDTGRFGEPPPQSRASL